MPPVRLRRALLLTVGLLLGLRLGALPAAADEPRPGARLDLPSPRVWDTRAREVAGAEVSAGFGAALITVPAMLKTGEAIGRTSSDYLAATLPGILLLAVVPPLAVTASEWGVGRGMRGRGVVRFHPAVWAAFGVNLVAVIAGAATGVNASDPMSASIFTIVDGMAMSLSTMLVLHYTQRRPPIVRTTEPLPPVGLQRAIDGSLPKVMLPSIAGGLTAPVYVGRF
jgi:hypothetical protein